MHWPGISGICPCLTAKIPARGLVHRIDKDTSGLLVVAKTELAKTKLGMQFFDKVTERTYQALVWGSVKDDEGTIEGNIGRSLKNRQVFTVFPDGEFGKPAVTHYKVLRTDWLRYPWLNVASKPAVHTR
jgi:23S rRNA pseudouridine1911/1915/1917 synthase